MEKKRSWKFNAVDVIVILIIIAAVAFLAMRLLDRSNDKPAARPGVMEYVVEVSGLEKEVYDNVAALLPCQMAASGKWVAGSYINAVESVPCQVEKYEASNPVNAHYKPQVLPGEDEEFVTAYFYCSAEVDLNDMLNLVGTQEVRIGRSHYVKGVNFELVGTILSVEKHEQ